MAAEIDPRYAAQFQRGFDPAQHTPTLDRRAPVPVAAPAPPLVAPIPPPPPFREPTATDLRIVEPADDLEPERAVPTARLDWLLPLLALVLAGASVATFWNAVTDVERFYGTGGMADYAYAMMISALPGPLMGAAVLALSTWLVLRALRGRRAS